MAQSIAEPDEPTRTLLAQLRRNAEAQLLPAIRLYTPNHEFTPAETEHMQQAELGLLQLTRTHGGSAYLDVTRAMMKTMGALTRAYADIFEAHALPVLRAQHRDHSDGQLRDMLYIPGSGNFLPGALLETQYTAIENAMNIPATPSMSVKPHHLSHTPNNPGYILRP